MAYGRKSYRSTRGRRSGTRKYTRKSRGRFAKKRFSKYKSNGQSTKVSAPVNARETYVKLPWINTFASTSLTAATSSSRAFLGNSLIPFPASYAGSITSGDEWVSGVSEYASFYNQYRVLGSSIKLQILCQTQAGVTFGVCLVPITAGGPETGVTGSIANRITELDALSYDELCMQPYAKCRLIGIGSGGNANVFLKMFRKTKMMLACKDLRDNENTLLRLPDPTGSFGSINTNARDSFFYYVRVFNVAGATGSFDMQVKMKYYTNLSGRTNWTPITVPA